MASRRSSFEEGTTEAYWGPNDEDKYVLRFIHGETCCMSPYGDVEDWPMICFTDKWSPDDEDSEDYDFKLSVIAGLWMKETGKFVGFWGADEGDGHVDFYCRSDCEEINELESISGVLCTKICPQLIDVFDDGSGSEREPRMVSVSVFNNELLNKLYTPLESGEESSETVKETEGATAQGSSPAVEASPSAKKSRTE